MTVIKDKGVTRVTQHPYRVNLTGATRGEGRKIVVSLEPGDMLVMREQGCRQRYEIGIADVFRILVKGGWKR